MSRLIALDLPIPWEALGPALGSADPWDAGGVILARSETPAWGWEGARPALAIPSTSVRAAAFADRWWVDHVVVLVPDLARAVDRFGAVGLDPRLRMQVRDRPAAFFRAGPVIEVVESPVRDDAIYGVALATDEPLEVVTLRLRAAGFDTSDPRPAIQPHRRILTVAGLGAGLAIMSPDDAA